MNQQQKIPETFKMEQEQNTDLNYQADARHTFADEAITLQLASCGHSKFTTCGGIPGASAAFGYQSQGERRESKNALRSFYQDLSREMDRKDREYLQGWAW